MIGFLFRNWHIKLAALAIATVFYTGIVFSGSFREETWTGSIAIQPVDQPQGWYLLEPESLYVVSVDYRVPVQMLGRLSSDSFQAVVDLGEYDLARAGEPQRLSVTVTADDDIEVRDWNPRAVTVTLDEVAARPVQVVVDHGEVPDGYAVGTPRVDVRSVQVQGPRSLLNEVVQAVARVRIDPTGVDVSQQVALVAVNAEGDEVQRVELSPALATVDIEVRATETNKTVPVAWQLEGNPATGYVLQGVTADPAVVTVRGTPDALAELQTVATAPISIDGLTASRTFSAELQLPDGARLLSDVDVALTAQVVPAQGSRTLLLGVVCRGAPAGARCEPQTSQVAATLSGALPVLNQLSAADVTPVVSAAGLSPGRHTVELSYSLPDGIELVASSPAEVEVVIAPPASPAPGASPTPVPTAAP